MTGGDLALRQLVSERLELRLDVAMLVKASLGVVFGLLVGKAEGILRDLGLGHKRAVTLRSMKTPARLLKA